MPYDGGRVNEHFGQSREFAIFTVEGGKIADSKIVNSQDLCHNHEGLAGLLKDEGVEAVITGGIGYSMVAALPGSDGVLTEPSPFWLKCTQTPARRTRCIQ